MLQTAAAMKPANEAQAMGTWKKRMRLEPPWKPPASEGFVWAMWLPTWRSTRS